MSPPLLKQELPEIIYEENEIRGKYMRCQAENLRRNFILLFLLAK